MAFTAPRTWVVNEVVTASLLNVQLRDNMLAIGDGWIGYTPAWTATGTAPALGNGTLVGAYIKQGRTVHYRVQFTSGSTTTYGTGAYRFSLPVTASLSIVNWPMGEASVVDTSAAAAYLGVAIQATSTTIAILHQSAAGASGSVGQVSPVTFATGDQIYATGTYESST